MRQIFSELIWGKVEYKNQEPVFKVAHPDLEYDKKNIPETEFEIMNYNQFLDFKFKLKTPEEEPNEEYRTLYNEEVT